MWLGDRRSTGARSFGLKLIKGLMDEVSIETDANGTVVRVCHRIGEGSRPPAGVGDVPTAG